MADGEKVVTQENPVEEVKEENTVSEKIEKTEQETKKEKGKVKEKKPGKIRQYLKANWKQMVGAFVGGAAIGVGGTVGISKLGEAVHNRKMRNQQTYVSPVSPDDEVLSPNQID